MEDMAVNSIISVALNIQVVLCHIVHSLLYSLFSSIFSLIFIPRILHSFRNTVPIVVSSICKSTNNLKRSQFGKVCTIRWRLNL